MFCTAPKMEPQIFAFQLSALRNFGYMIYGCQPKNRGKTDFTPKMDGFSVVFSEKKAINMDDLGKQNTIFVGNTHMYQLFYKEILNLPVSPAQLQNNQATFDSKISQKCQRYATK